MCNPTYLVTLLTPLRSCHTAGLRRTERRKLADVKCKEDDRLSKNALQDLGLISCRSLVNRKHGSFMGEGFGDGIQSTEWCRRDDASRRVNELHSTLEVGIDYSQKTLDLRAGGNLGRVMKQLNGLTKCCDCGRDVSGIEMPACPRGPVDSSLPR